MFGNFLKSRNRGNRTFRTYSKRRAPNNPEDPPNSLQVAALCRRPLQLGCSWPGGWLAWLGLAWIGLAWLAAWIFNDVDGFLWIWCHNALGPGTTCGGVKGQAVALFETFALGWLAGLAF